MQNNPHGYIRPDRRKPSLEVLKERQEIQEAFKKRWGLEEVDPASLTEPIPNYLDRVALVRFNPEKRPEQDTSYTKLCELVRARWKKSPPACAAVINFLPIPLFSDSVLPVLRFPGCCVPASPKYGLFGLKTFTEPFIEPFFQPNGKAVPFEWYPIQLAQEFVKKNPEGVVVKVFESVLPEIIEGPEIDLARQEAHAWCMRQAEEPIIINGLPCPSPWKDIAIRRLLDLVR